MHCHERRWQKKMEKTDEIEQELESLVAAVIKYKPITNKKNGR